jgi:hypothetical protein
MMDFINAHIGMLASVALLLVQEFVANSSVVQSNSLGHMLLAPVIDFLKSKAQPKA